MTLARAISRLAAAFTGIEPDAYEITLWGSISVEEHGDGDGALVLHPGGIGFSQPPALLNEGFAIDVPYSDIALFRCIPGSFELQAIHGGKLKKYLFVPSSDTHRSYIAEAASRIRLRMLGIIPCGSPWPSVVLPDCHMEKAADAAHAMEELARLFPEHSEIICRQAALLIAAGNPSEAIDVLAASGATRAENEKLMMIISMICAGRTRHAETLLNELSGDIAGITQACARLKLFCRLQRQCPKIEWTGWLEELFLASALRDCCIRPEWPAVRKALLAPGVLTFELVAALFDDDQESAVRLLDQARRESWFDPLISILAEASCLALEGDFSAAFLRLWPARGRAVVMPLLCLASASGNELRVLEWLDAADASQFVFSPDERGVLAHLLWRAGKHEKASSLLGAFSNEERAALHPDTAYRVSVIESQADGRPDRGKTDACLNRLKTDDEPGFHPEAARFAAELHLILAEKEAAVDHQRDARSELIRASSMIDDCQTDPLWHRLERLRNKILFDISPSTWKGITGIVGKAISIVPDERRTELTDAWAGIAATAANPLTIAFIGEFNAGKSSIVNALLKRNLLPTGVLPTTRLPCAIEHATIESLIGVKDGGIVTPRPLEDLQSLLEERHDGTGPQLPEFARMLLFVRLPTISNLRILDLPGLNARLVRHQTCSEAAVEEADIVVWIDNATQFAAASNTRSRTRLARAWQSLILVLNRVDEIDPAERNDVISGWLQHLGDTNDHRLFITACPQNAGSIEGIREFSTWLAAMNDSAPRMIGGYRKRRLLEFLGRLQKEVENSHSLSAETTSSDDGFQPPPRFQIQDAAVRDLVGRLHRQIDDWKRIGMPMSAVNGTIRNLVIETLKIDDTDGLGIARLAGEVSIGNRPEYQLIRRICDDIARETFARRMRRFHQERAERRRTALLARAELAVQKMMFTTPLLEVIRGVSDDRIADLPWLKK